MTLQDRRQEFEKLKQPSECAIQHFSDIDGYDVYNCSVPFMYKGKQYIYGRVERRTEWARSHTMLFVSSGKDEWTRVKNTETYQLEDPHIAIIGGELILGGVYVIYSQGKIAGPQNMFYRGNDLNDLYYFTSGPQGMKDIRLVELADHRIGVFSRPRNQEIIDKFGAASQIGFTIVDSLNDVSDKVITDAPYIPGIFDDGEWGGCNQAYLLDSGNIGVIGHKSYQSGETSTYLCIAFVFDPNTHTVINEKIIATSQSFPTATAKMTHLTDCAFTSGIVVREDGMVDLYSGLGDTVEGRVVIDNPFNGFGNIVTPYAVV